MRSATRPEIRKLPNHTALKEWSNVIDALANGRQVVLIRKGGVADPQFGLDAERFYLYPTYFHQGEQEHRASVTVTHWAEVVKAWKVTELALLERLEPFVEIPRETLEARYRFRPDQALNVIGLRVWRLAAPVEVMFREDYAGCLSWISVDEEIDITGSVRVLSEAELQDKLSAISSRLSD